MRSLRHHGGRVALSFGLLMLLALPVQAAEILKPFILASTSSGELQAKVDEVRQSLKDSGFQVLGEYSPIEQGHVIVVTNDTLTKAAAATERGGYAAAQRVSVTRHDGDNQVAYVNPVYIENAYRLDSDLSPVADQLADALGRQKPFGAEGLKPKDLRKYHYTFGMEYFDDPYELAEYDSHQEAVDAVEEGLAEERAGVYKVFRYDIPDTDVTLFGIGMSQDKGGKKAIDDAYQLSVVDFGDLKRTCYLPYTMLVNGKAVEALHMRFRMAVHFPDLSMMGEHSFMKLMSSPEAIQKALTKVAGGKMESGFF